MQLPGTTVHHSGPVAIALGQSLGKSLGRNLNPKSDVLASLRATDRDSNSAFAVTDHSRHSATERLAEVWSDEA